MVKDTLLKFCCTLGKPNRIEKLNSTNLMPLGNLTIVAVPSKVDLSTEGRKLLLWSVQKVIWGFQINRCGFHALKEQIKLIFGV